MRLFDLRKLADDVDREHPDWTPEQKSAELFKRAYGPSLDAMSEAYIAQGIAICKSMF